MGRRGSPVTGHLDPVPAGLKVRREHDAICCAAHPNRNARRWRSSLLRNDADVADDGGHREADDDVAPRRHVDEALSVRGADGWGFGTLCAMGLLGNAGDIPGSVVDSDARAFWRSFVWAGRGAVALAVAVFASGCGSGTTGSGMTGSATSGSASQVTASEMACGDWFDATMGAGCRRVALPAAELARERARYVVLCQSWLGLPGQPISVSAFEVCAQAMKASGGCTGGANLAAACSFPATGALSDGASCADSGQCSSGVCTLRAGSANCGTCAAATPVGQSCSTTDCVGPLVCAGQPPTCQTPRRGAAGAACDTGANGCAPGLTCNRVTNVCSVPSGVGAVCGNANDCDATLVCSLTSLTCQPPGTAGAPCAVDADCGGGLGCLPNSKSAMQCGTIVGWASSGEPCDTATRCIVGSCDLPTGASADEQGTCPDVIPDGQPCSPTQYGQTCDVYAVCSGYSCTLGEPQACP